MDKKLSSVSAVSDMNYVYAETSSGETVKISKADLASVVAGMIDTRIFGFKTYKWDSNGPSSEYVMDSFNGIVIYRRRWLGNHAPCVASVDTNRNVIQHIGGHDITSDLLISDGKLALKGSSGSWWGGIRIIFVGVFE